MMFKSDKQRKAIFAQMNSSSSMMGLRSAATVNRFSYPSPSVLSVPPKYVYDGGYVNQFSNDPELGDGSVKNAKRSERHFYPDPGIYDDEKHHIEVLRRGGISYVTAPDSPEEFKKYEDEMRRKLDKKKFAADEKKLKQANLSGELLDSEVFDMALERLRIAPEEVAWDCQGDIRRDVRNEMYKIKKEAGVPKQAVLSSTVDGGVEIRLPSKGEDSSGAQVCFGNSYKPGRMVKKTDFARKSPEDLRMLNKERMALMGEINNTNDLARERRSEIVKRLDQINDVLEGGN